MHSSSQLPNEPYPGSDPDASAREILIGDERVRIVEAGAPESFPIVLLHGWGASAYSFRGLLGPLAAAGYRAIAPDLRGHGWSATRLSRGAWTREAMSEWVQRVLDQLAVKECVMVGQSIGGAVALDAAARMPDRIRAVVLLAPIGFTTIRRVLLARVFPWVTVPTTPRWIVAGILRDIYGVRAQWNARDLDEYWMPLRRGDVVKALLQSAREFDFTPRDPRPLRNCRIVIRLGELDGLIRPAAALKHARLFDCVDVDVLPGVGHVPAEEIPGEIAMLILDVASQIRSQAADTGSPLSRG